MGAAEGPETEVAETEVDGATRLTATTSTVVQMQGEGKVWDHLTQCAKVPGGTQPAEPPDTARGRLKNTIGRKQNGWRASHFSPRSKGARSSRSQGKHSDCGQGRRRPPIGNGDQIGADPGGSATTPKDEMLYDHSGVLLCFAGTFPLIC